MKYMTTVGNKLLSDIQSSMSGIGLRQFTILLLGAVMSTVGFIGLTGGFSSIPAGRTVLLGSIIVAIGTLSFYIGRTYAQPR